MGNVSAADLDLFLTVLDAGSLTGAAARLSVDQGTVSRRLAGAEVRAGGPLFVRARDGIRLTALGVAFEAPARAAALAVLEARRASAAALGGVSGRVRIATAESIADHFLVPALPDRTP